MGNEMVEIEVEVRRETEKGLAVFDGSREAWLPKSLIVTGINDGDYRTGHSYFISLPEWLALKKGLI